MTRAERIKRLRGVVAQIATMALVPHHFRAAVAEIVDELDELDARIEKLERMACPPQSRT